MNLSDTLRSLLEQDPDMPVAELARRAGCSRASAYNAIRQFGPLVGRTPEQGEQPLTPREKRIYERVQGLSARTSRETAVGILREEFDLPDAAARAYYRAARSRLGSGEPMSLWATEDIDLPIARLIRLGDGATQGGVIRKALNERVKQLEGSHDGEQQQAGA